MNLRDVEILKRLRDLKPEKVRRLALRNPQLALALVLFTACVAIVGHIPPLGGALAGAGASLLGAWITEQNKKTSDAEEKARRQSEARQYLAPELNRTIERVLYIHGRATANFICASADSEIKPNDLKEDFIPYWPILYPNAPQFKDLSGDDAVALITFYDSLHALGKTVEDWWNREGQLPVNIFNGILHQAGESLELALICIEKFELEKLHPPKHESWGAISSRIKLSRSSEESARAGHIKRFEAKAASKAPPLPQRARRV